VTVRRAAGVALLAGTCVLSGGPGGAYSRAEWPAPADTLDVRRATRAIDTIRHALPEGWDAAEIRWGTLPQGWHGAPECLLVEVQDKTISFRHPQADFSYHPFYKLWLLPPGWEGRMEVAAIDPEARPALYLGESADFRVLVRTLGHNTWPDGPDVIGAALGLETFPLTPRPEHTLDVSAMQKLFQRLDAATPDRLDRWRRQIYGIRELDRVLYLELLTWEDRPDERGEDPTFLGKLAEAETRFLSREALAAFPDKHGLYLRRLTRESFSDVIVVKTGVAGS